MLLRRSPSGSIALFSAGAQPRRANRPGPARPARKPPPSSDRPPLRADAGVLREVAVEPEEAAVALTAAAIGDFAARLPDRPAVGLASLDVPAPDARPARALAVGAADFAAPAAFEAM